MSANQPGPAQSQAILPQPPSHHGTPLLRIFALLIFAVLIAVLSSLGTFFLLTKQSPIQNSINLNETRNPTLSKTEEQKEEPPFCKQYGAYQIKMTDLLEEYLVGPGETMRDIAKKKLGDETKATDLTIVNPQLSQYEIDSELPMGMKLYLPNEKYNSEGITAYLKASGNIAFNKNKPMFGINAPNSGTGPFTISESIEGDLINIEEGDCVVVISGSRAFDPQKVVFEVVPQ